jgi:hypothetical protein
MPKIKRKKRHEAESKKTSLKNMLSSKKAYSTMQSLQPFWTDLQNSQKTGKTS